jgi:hypothetical protein
VLDDPDVRVRRDRAVHEETRYSGACAFVPVNAADDEHTASTRGITELERVDRTAAYRVPEQLSVLHLRGGKDQADEGLDHHEGYGTVARQVPVTGM